MREVGISDLGAKKLRRRASKEGKPSLLASRRKIDVARKELETEMEYIVLNGVIRLQSIENSVLKRIEQFNPDVSKKSLISVDKGQGKLVRESIFTACAKSSAPLFYFIGVRFISLAIHRTLLK